MTDELERAWRRIQMIIGRGKVSSVNDGGRVQRVQVQINGLETRDNTPRLAEYGFASFPHPDCDAVLLFLGGDRSQGVIIATNDQRYRLHLAEGEVAIHDDLGQKVHLTRAGIVVSSPTKVTVEALDAQVNVKTAEVVATTSASVTAPSISLGASGQSLLSFVTSAFQALFNGHTHPVPGGTSGVPNQTMDSDHLTSTVKGG